MKQIAEALRARSEQELLNTLEDRWRRTGEWDQWKAKK